MKNKIKFTKDEIRIKSIIVLALFFLLILSFFFAENIEVLLGLKINYYENQVNAEVINNSDYFVSYLDVGQGNCSVIKFPDGKVLVVDGGSLDNGQKIVEYLNDIGIESIDYMIATHADSDHIGGLISVLNNFDVKNIYRPFQIAGTGTSYDTFVASEYEDLAGVYDNLILTYGERTKISRVTSYEYNEFISKIYNEIYLDNGIYQLASVTVFYDGLKIIGDDYCIEFFAPLLREDNINMSDYSNTSGYATIGYGVENSNGNSAIFLVSINDEKFFYTGDAPWTDSDVSKTEKFEELDFIDSLSELEKIEISNVSVYLVGHHGSKYSSSNMLLDLIKPTFNVISVDINNLYGFPSNEVIQRLNNYKIVNDYLLLTGKHGNITFASNGNNLVYCLEKSNRDGELLISWYLLGVIIFVFVSYSVISVRVKKETD